MDAYREQKARISSLETLIEKEPCTKLSSLAIGGKEVAALGYRGREIGRRLEDALFAVMQGKVRNEREVLLSFVGKKE